MLHSYWDIGTLIIYIIFGLVSELCVLAVRKRKKREVTRSVIKKEKKVPKEYILMFILWEVFACCRLVTVDIGGADANAYARYFEECLGSNFTTGYETHAEILYRLLNKGIRLLTDEYHIFFFVCHGIIIVSYIMVIEEFFPLSASSVPFILLVFVYIRGFVTLRSILAASIVLISIVELNKKRNKTAILLAVASLFIHKATVFYSLFLLFYYLYRKNKIGIKTVIIWIVVASGASVLVQRILATTSFSFLSTGSYVYFSQQSLKTSFLGGGWKIVASQLFLAVAVLIFNKKIDKQIRKSVNTKKNDELALVRLVCYYDFMMIPVNYILNVWRGYEYFYIFRLIMWGIIINIIKKMLQKNYRILVSILFFAVFVSWFIFRIERTWEDSRIMPYIFEPLYNLTH